MPKRRPKSEPDQALLRTAWYLLTLEREDEPPQRLNGMDMIEAERATRKARAEGFKVSTRILWS